MSDNSKPLVEGRVISSGVAPKPSIPKPRIYACGQSVAHRNTDLDEYDNFVHDKYGYCYYSLKPGEPPWIYNLYVEPRYRRQGHAKRLIQQVKDKIRLAGHTGAAFVEAKPGEPGIEMYGLTRLYTNSGLVVVSTNHITKENTP